MSAPAANQPAPAPDTTGAAPGAGAAAMSGAGAGAGVAVVIGAGGGVGAALLAQLAAGAAPGPFDRVLALARRPLAAAALPPGVASGTLDLLDEASIAAAAAQARALGPVRLVLLATGLLHADGVAPEKHLGQLDAAAMARVFAVNTVGPALVAKHFLPLLPRQGRGVFAALSARVGSIQDNRLGGWHSYRASKAALNMLLKTLAIELARRAPEALCIGLHPGTVATPLSEPFRSQVPAHQLFTPQQSAAHLLRVIAQATPEHSGQVLAWDGQRVPA